MKLKIAIVVAQSGLLLAADGGRASESAHIPRHDYILAAPGLRVMDRPENAKQKRPKEVVDEYMSRYPEFRRKYSAAQQEVLMNVNVRDRYYSRDWRTFKKAVQTAVLKHEIHPDDISYMEPVLYNAVALNDRNSGYNDVEFARFLLAHDANPNGVAYDKPILAHATTVPMAVALIAHGADVRHVNALGQTCLHTSVFRNPDLALLHYMAGADPQVVDNQGFTPLMRLVHDVVRGHICSNARNIKSFLALATMFVDIGVPLDACVTAGCRDETGAEEACCRAGDDVWTVMLEGNAYHRYPNSAIPALQNCLRAAATRVSQHNFLVQSRTAAATREALPALPAPVVSIVIDYSNSSIKHSLPPSVVPALRRLRQEVDLFKRQFDAELKEQVDQAARHVE